MKSTVTSLLIVIASATICGGILLCCPRLLPPPLRRAWMSHQLDRIASSHNGRVQLYGKVVDQDGNGLTDVSIGVRLAVQDSYTHSHGTTISTMTDKAGIFQITDGWATNLVIEHVAKDGYLQGPGRESFTFDPLDPQHFIPNPALPITIHMWKKSSTEPLIHYVRNSRLLADGRPYTVDLLRGAVLEGIAQDGDIRISIMRPAKITPFMPFDWSYTVEIVEGGLKLTKDPFPYQAPQSGYQPTFIFISKALDHPRPDPRQIFYIRSRNGKVYASVRLSLSPDVGGDAELGIESFANPAGSTNVAPDRTKDIER